MLFKRLLCTQTAVNHRNGHRIKWPVTQVTKSNLSNALNEIEALMFNSDFVAVSLQKTGGHSAPWQKILSIDTAETAYVKAKHAAERFQILQFAVCPFSVQDSKLVAHPYNFHLFPRDELKVGMPSYSFSCQSSYLTSMAQEGFDFNACIYNGISYLSRAQESVAKVQNGHSFPSSYIVQSSTSCSVADSLFKERTKTRVKNWINACKCSNKAEDVLISSLRKLITGSEAFGSRPSLTIDICSERQVQLALEALNEFAEVVALQPLAKGVGVQIVRVVFTSSEEDKNLLKKELQDMEREERMRARGFREVMELISTSQKPVVAHNSLHDFTFIHSTFVAPLPPTLDEFKGSLHAAFPCILDVNSLMEEIGPFSKTNNLQAAIAYLNTRFPAPIDMDVSKQGEPVISSITGARAHQMFFTYSMMQHPNGDCVRFPAETENLGTSGNNVLRVCKFFAKLCSVLKISAKVPQGDNSPWSPSLQRHFNKLTPMSRKYIDPVKGDARIRFGGNGSTIDVNNLVFLWGFQRGLSVQNLKHLLCDAHGVRSEDLDVKLVDKTCAVVVFWTPGLSQRFSRPIANNEIPTGKLSDTALGGLKVADYAMYNRVCKSNLWKPDLAECLDVAVDEEAEVLSIAELQQEQSVVYWNSDEMINLDDL